VTYRTVILGSALLAALGLAQDASAQRGGGGGGGGGGGQQNARQNAGPPGMITLTDGTSMANFDQVGNASWRVAERAVAADRGNGFLLTKEPYGDFKLRAEFYADEGTNSGVFIRCENPAMVNAQTCYEVNIYDSNPNKDNATGAIVGVTKVNPVPQTELKWNVIEIEAKGPQMNVSVNGERTSSGRDTKHLRGRIGLQYNGGVIYWRKVQIQPLTAADIEAENQSIQAYCSAGFGIIFPGQPQVRDVNFNVAGKSMPAKEYAVEKGGNHYSVTSIEMPGAPYSDVETVKSVLADLSKKGQVQTQAMVELGLGRPGGQLNIAEPNGRQLRASAYMAAHRMIVTQAEATRGETDALLFEQSVVLVNHAGTDLDRVAPGNDAPRTYDCK